MKGFCFEKEKNYIYETLYLPCFKNFARKRQLRIRYAIPKLIIILWYTLGEYTL